MLDRVKNQTIENNRKITELLPLHKLLILTFPNIEKILINKLSQNPNIDITKIEIKLIVSELLDYKDDLVDPLEKNKSIYLGRITKIIRKLSSDNTLFYSDLPKGWEEYLKISIEEIICSMKNKDYLNELFEIVIQKIKLAEKIKFNKILDTLTTNKSTKYELNKILELLRDKYKIDFIKVGGEGCLLKIDEIEKKTDILENIDEIKKALNRIKDKNGITINIIIDNLFFFINKIVINRPLNEFWQHEFTLYCLEKNPELEISTIRSFIKSIFKNLIEQGIIIKNKSTLSYNIKFNQNINKSYNFKYFTKINSNQEILNNFNNGFGILSQNSKPESIEALELLKNELIYLNTNGDFFILKNFLEKYNIDKNKLIYFSRILTKLIKLGVIGIKGRERFYIINKNIKNNSDALELFNFNLFLNNFFIKGKINNLHNKILFYIFKDIGEIFDINEIKIDDLDISIDDFSIDLLFKNNKFAKYQNNILLICDEVSEKMSVNIHPKFTN